MRSDKKKYNLFILSLNEEEQDFTNKLAFFLKEKGKSVWLSTGKPQAGSLAPTLRSVLKLCDYAVVLVNKGDQQAAPELNSLFAKGTKSIIPVLRNISHWEQKKLYPDLPPRTAISGRGAEHTMNRLLQVMSGPKAGRTLIKGRKAQNSTSPAEGEQGIILLGGVPNISDLG